MACTPGKISTIPALIVGLAAGLSLATGHGDDDSWAGKRIMTKEAAPNPSRFSPVACPHASVR